MKYGLKEANRILSLLVKQFFLFVSKKYAMLVYIVSITIVFYN